jgi:succinyl-CoA synthetase alpha subunit
MIGKKLGAKDYTLAKTWENLSDAKAAKAVKEGVKAGDKSIMKPTDGITEADVAAVVDYMKSFKK